MPNPTLKRDCAKARSPFLLARRARLDLREATDTLMEIERRLFAVVERGARLLEQERLVNPKNAEPSNE